MKTPDGKEFRSGFAGSPLAAAGAAALDGLRLLGKLIATVWRLAGALDAALWRGVKLFARAIAGAAAVTSRVVLWAITDFLRWLPSRSGRAYSAFSGAVLIVAGLYIVDELRISPAETAGGGERARAPVDREDPILARVGGRYIHLSEVVAAARASGSLRDGESLSPQAAFERDLVKAYVEQRLLSRAATDEGLHRSVGVGRQLAAARDRILASAFMESRLSTIVTEDTIERLYKTQSDVTRLGDEVRARHIVVETGEAAAAIIASLDEGADFAELAQARSIDRSTAPLGGEIGYFTRDMMSPALAAAAFSTPVGVVAPPFQTEFGWHVLEVLDRRPTSGVPLSAVQDNIRRFLTLRAIERTIAELSEKNDVVYFPPAPPNGAGERAQNE